MMPKRKGSKKPGFAVPVCPSCNKPGERLTGDVLYGNPELASKVFYACKACDTRVGTHPNGMPLGVMADGVTRKFRQDAHAIMDTLWRGNVLDRSVAYGMLARDLGIPVDSCHFGQMDSGQCSDAIDVIRGWSFYRWHDLAVDRIGAWDRKTYDIRQIRGLFRSADDLTKFLALLTDSMAFCDDLDECEQIVKEIPMWHGADRCLANPLTASIPRKFSFILKSANEITREINREVYTCFVSRSGPVRRWSTRRVKADGTFENAGRGVDIHTLTGLSELIRLIGGSSLCSKSNSLPWLSLSSEDLTEANRIGSLYLLDSEVLPAGDYGWRYVKAGQSIRVLGVHYTNGVKRFYTGCESPFLYSDSVASAAFVTSAIRAFDRKLIDDGFSRFPADGRFVREHMNLVREQMPGTVFSITREDLINDGLRDALASASRPRAANPVFEIPEAAQPKTKQAPSPAVPKQNLENPNKGRSIEF